MLRVTIDLVPFGMEARKRNIGTIEIANDGAGTRERGNYMVRLAKRGQPAQTWRRGVVSDFPRLTLGPYDLLLRALLGTVGARNERLLDQVKAELEAANEPMFSLEDQPIETPNAA